MLNQPTIILFFTFLSILSMFIFPNTIYYSLNLLIIVFLTLSYLFYTGCITSLTLLILLIIYVGAIIILIGYVCAVCPNVNFSSNIKYLYAFAIFSLFSAFMAPSAFMTPSTSLLPVFNFFYSSSGVPVFFILVFMLFIILLVVTSYYFSPKGPFRSVF